MKTIAAAMTLMMTLMIAAVACGDDKPRGLVSSTSEDCPAPEGSGATVPTTGEPPPSPGTGTGQTGGTSGSNTGGGVTPAAVVTDCTQSGVPGGTTPLPNPPPTTGSTGTSGTSGTSGF